MRPSKPEFISKSTFFHYWDRQQVCDVRCDGGIRYLILYEWEVNEEFIYKCAEVTGLEIYNTVMQAKVRKYVMMRAV